MKRSLIVTRLTITRSLTTSFLIDDLCAGAVDLLQAAKQTTASSLAALEVCQTLAQQLVSILSKDYRKAWGYSVLHLRLVFGVLSLTMLFICILMAGFGACVGGCSLLEKRISLCMILFDIGVEGSSYFVSPIHQGDDSHSLDATETGAPVVVWPSKGLLVMSDSLRYNVALHL